MSAGNRFRETELDDAITSSNLGGHFEADTDVLVELLRGNSEEQGIIGANEVFQGAYGSRRLLYCDWTASGRCVSWIEDFLRERVYTLYGNSHTTQSITGHQSTLFLHEAKMLIKRLVNANFSKGPSKDLLLFYGSGVTGCTNALIKILGLHVPPADPSKRAVVFVGPYEHHSNLVPWRECSAEVVDVPADSTGAISLTALDALLKRYADRPTLIGSFSAASNVTGLLSDVPAVNVLLHSHGALAFWDYASAAPYVKINMNRAPHKDDYCDAILVSPHKFMGGPGAPGMLVVKKKLFTGDVPAEPGGGTVFFVNQEDHVYLRRIEEREEGGTPDIIGAIRCALAFQLKACIGETWIARRDQQLRAKAVERWSQHKAIRLLGATEAPQEAYLPTFSLVVAHRSGRMLHYNFVTALLNDLFGIQCRGGCMCAGPFGERLLGMDNAMAAKFQEALLEHDDNEILRPGFVRLNLHYTLSDEQAEFVIAAVEFVATHGWKLLPEYVFEADTGEFYHPKMKKFPDRRWLEDLSYAGGVPKFKRSPRDQQIPFDDYKTYLSRAADIVAEAQKTHRLSSVPRAQVALREIASELRWFVLPWETLNEQHTELWNLEASPLRLTAGSGIVAQQHAPVAAPQQEEAEMSDSKGKQEESDGAFCPTVPEYREASDLPAPVSQEEYTGAKWHYPTRKTILGKVQRAIDEFDMIQPGDRILVCVSGGKDSLTLLHTIKQLQYQFKNFEFAAMTVDPMTVSFDPRPLIPYMKALGVPYFYEQQPIIDIAKEKSPSSICSWCARMKRGIIYKVARREGYNVVAMGQHLDDICESFMMSVFLNGRLRTMKAHYTVDKGDLRVIRPFLHVREAHLKEFAAEHMLPVISENCPACFSEPLERDRMKTLLENTSLVIPGLYNSLDRAMVPLYQEDIAMDTRAERRQQSKDRFARFRPTKNPGAKKPPGGKKKKRTQWPGRDKAAEHGQQEDEAARWMNASVSSVALLATGLVAGFFLAKSRE